MDKVLATVDPEGTCVLVGKQTGVYLNDDNHGPVVWITPEKFKDKSAQAAAAKIAKPIDCAPPANELPLFYGTGTRERYTMTILRPVYSGDFAFVDFSGPGAEIGAIALRKSGSDWTVVEHAHLGFW